MARPEPEILLKVGSMRFYGNSFRSVFISWNYLECLMHPSASCSYLSLCKLFVTVYIFARLSLNV
jgi:hypothetical protein